MFVLRFLVFPLMRLSHTMRAFGARINACVSGGGAG